MDSANSGSIQSSSGRDHENNQHDFDDSMAAASHQVQFLPQHHQTPNFFDNHDLVWPRAGAGLRSDPNFAFFGTLTTTPSSSLPSTATDPLATVQNNSFLGASSSMDHGTGRPPSNTIKNPKKRTRASRRAPTTVLTTDVTNFRQMVQEFTGIPASPYTGSPYSRSFDLFSAASALRTGANLHHPLRPLYPTRPSAAGKLPSPFSSTNPITIGNSNNPNDENAAIAAAATNPTNNYHHLFNLQHHQRNLPLQLGAVNTPMNLANLSGFLNRETPPSMRTNDGDGRIWKSGETMGRSMNDGGGIELNHNNVVGFDSNAGRGPPPQLSGYNLNIIAEKGMENAAAGSASGSGGGGTTAAAGEGTAGSWICTSH